MKSKKIYAFKNSVLFSPFMNSEKDKISDILSSAQRNKKLRPWIHAFLKTPEKQNTE